MHSQLEGTVLFPETERVPKNFGFSNTAQDWPART
jgi:hypothetical protein